jgi:hypothetical protein
LTRVGGEEGEIDHDEQCQEQAGLQPVPVPQRAHHDEGEQGVDHHGQGDRDAVGGGEVRRRLEAEHQHDHGQQQQPVDVGDVDLPLFALRGEFDLDPRAVAELHGLAGQRERPGNDGLRGDDGGGRGQRDHGIEQHPEPA